MQDRQADLRLLAEVDEAIAGLRARIVELEPQVAGVPADCIEGVVARCILRIMGLRLKELAEVGVFLRMVNAREAWQLPHASRGHVH